MTYSNNKVLEFLIIFMQRTPSGSSGLCFWNTLYFVWKLQVPSVERNILTNKLGAKFKKKNLFCQWNVSGVYYTVSTSRMNWIWHILNILLAPPNHPYLSNNYLIQSWLQTISRTCFILKSQAIMNKFARKIDKSLFILYPVTV